VKYDPSLDELIDDQPELWARAMLDEAEATRSKDGRDAILARIGLTLYARFAVILSADEMRSASGQITWKDTA
jgi:hypothetical protein